MVVRFGIFGLMPEQATPIVRRLIDESWPDVRRYRQCVYVVRLRGQVAIGYGDEYSPVIYIGEGNAYHRLYSHAEWIASLFVNVPNIEVEIHIAEIALKNNKKLYQHVEADMIKWFYDAFGYLPWFNRQREKGKEGYYDYQKEAIQSLRRHTNIEGPATSSSGPSVRFRTTSSMKRIPRAGTGTETALARLAGAMQKEMAHPQYVIQSGGCRDVRIG